MQKKRKQQNRKHFIALRKQRGAGLFQLATTLNENRVCDVGPITQAANDCLSNLGRADDCWGYTLENLVFTLDTPRNTRPTTVASELFLRLSVQVDCRGDDDSHNPFNDLQINFEVFDAAPPEAKSYISWHFDKNITSPEGAELFELHPLFHFQHGGIKTHTHLADDLGKILLLAPPRLPYPPMDAVLAIDFVLSNFKGSTWRELTRVAEYRRLVMESQHQFWRPYMQLLNRAFDGVGPDTSDPVFDIWPCLVVRRTEHERLLLEKPS